MFVDLQYKAKTFSDLNWYIRNGSLAVNKMFESFGALYH